MATNRYRSNRNNRGSRSSTSTNPQPQPTTTAQTLLNWFQGVDIQTNAHKLHRNFWLLVIGFYISQFCAGKIDNLFGHGWMLLLEGAVTVFLGYLWTIPELLAAQVAIAVVAAGNDPRLNSDVAIKSMLGTWFKWFLNVSAYTIGIVVTVLLLFDIKLGFDEMAGLLIVGTILGIVTAAIGISSVIALRIAQAGLIGCVVKIAITHIPTSTDGSILRDILTHNATFLGIATIILVLFGFGWTKTGGTWLWNNVITKIFAMLHPKNVIGLLFAAIILCTVLFAVYWFINPKDATRMMDAKVAQMQEAASESQSNQVIGSESAVSSQVTTQSPVNESEWVKVTTKTCEVAWNNADFKDGWCSLGEFPSGEYKFEVGSTLVKKDIDGTISSIPTKGFPFTAFSRDANYKDSVNFFTEWNPIKNNTVYGIMLRVNDGLLPMTNQKLVITQKGFVSISINFPATEANWKVQGFLGKITVTTLKKKA